MALRSGPGLPRTRFARHTWRACEAASSSSSSKAFTYRCLQKKMFGHVALRVISIVTCKHVEFGRLGCMRVIQRFLLLPFWNQAVHEPNWQAAFFEVAGVDLTWVAGVDLCTLVEV